MGGGHAEKATAEQSAAPRPALNEGFRVFGLGACRNYVLLERQGVYAMHVHLWGFRVKTIYIYIYIHSYAEMYVYICINNECIKIARRLCSSLNRSPWGMVEKLPCMHARHTWLVTDKLATLALTKLLHYSMFQSATKEQSCAALTIYML